MVYHIVKKIGIFHPKNEFLIHMSFCKKKFFFIFLFMCAKNSFLMKKFQFFFYNMIKNNIKIIKYFFQFFLFNIEYFLNFFLKCPYGRDQNFGPYLRNIQLNII